MRAKFPKLDEDLNKRFDDKKEYILKKREEKREERRQGRAAGNNGYPGSSDADYPEANGPDGGWKDALATVEEDNAGEWNAAITGATVPGIDAGEWFLDESNPARPVTGLRLLPGRFSPQNPQLRGKR